LFAGFIPLGKLAELVNIGTLFAFVMVCLGVVVLRITQPNLPRPFKTPWSPLVPLLGAASCTALMAFLPLDTWLRFVVWLALGVAFYFLYSMKHSALALESPAA
jgi:APA family basic amino acid/polyamine antiporter